MQPLQFTVAEGVMMATVEFLIFVLVLVTFATRYLAHRSHVRGAEEHGEEGIERYRPHSLASIALVLLCFYYTLLYLHGGIILSTLALAMFVADFFEFESRKVEARTDKELEPPRAAIGAGVLLFLYAAYVALFFLVEPFWSAVV